MSQQQIDQLFGYVQERCLWQFHSRSWDRQENIDGIIATATDLLHGQEHPKRHTPMDRMFYADAKAMVDDFKVRFPWILDLEPTRITELMKGLQSKLVDETITHSRNGELHDKLY